MTLDQRKVFVIAEFLLKSFVGCYVFHHEDKQAGAETYRIINATTAKALHRISVFREFLDNHAADEIVAVLQSRDVVRTLRRAGGHRVLVRKHIIEIDFGSRGLDVESQ